MTLQDVSGVTIEMLASRLRISVDDDTDGLTLALEATCSEIEPLVDEYSDIEPVPAGLKLAILDIAATRYDHTNISATEKIGAVSNNYTDEYDLFLKRIGPWRKIWGL